MTLDDATALAELLLEKHGLDKQGWTIKFDGRSKRFGVCKHQEKVIGLSAHLVRLNDEAKVENTVLHEIAHALVGRGRGHGPIWKAKALEVGCDGKTHYGYDVIEPELPIHGTCPNGHTSGRYRMPRGPVACGRCCRERNGGRYSEEFHYTWSRRS